MAKKLPLLLHDTRGRLDALIAKAAGNAGVIDPFDDIYRIVYYLTMRMLGTDDIADSAELLDTTLRLCEEVESSPSPARIIFPWLPTPAHRRCTVSAVRLHAIFRNIVRERRTSSTCPDDALQYILDNYGDVADDKITAVSYKTWIAFVLRPLTACYLPLLSPS